MSSFIDKKGKTLHHREFQIQQICVERGIQTLCHFSRIENLKSILQRGLVGRSILEDIEIQFLWNDRDRYDRCPEANCLSISFPNYQMFFRLRKTKEKIEGVNDSQWIVTRELPKLPNTSTNRSSCLQQNSSAIYQRNSFLECGRSEPTQRGTSISHP